MPQTDYIKYVPEERTMKRIGRFHTRLYRASFGLIGGRIDGLDILLLTTVGRKSGQKRTVPLPYFREGQSFVLIASFGGNDKNPAWLLNVQDQPDVEIQVGRRRMQVRARITEGEERAGIWTRITRDFPRYLAYQEKTTRQIPVVVLERG
jgi:deazaflavin-dependent oxidoreductase (nitroreductase family)